MKTRQQLEEGLAALKAEAVKRGITAPDWLKAEIHYYEAQLSRANENRWLELDDQDHSWERVEQRLRVIFFRTVGLGFLALAVGYALTKNL